MRAPSGLREVWFPHTENRWHRVRSEPGLRRTHTSRADRFRTPYQDTDYLNPARRLGDDPPARFRFSAHLAWAPPERVDARGHPWDAADKRRSRRRVSLSESPAARSTTGSPVTRSSTCGRPAVPCGSSSIHCGAIRMPASPGRIRTEPGKTSQHPQRSERRAAPAAGTAAARLTRALVWRAPASRDRGFRTVCPRDTHVSTPRVARFFISHRPAPRSPPG